MFMCIVKAWGRMVKKVYWEIICFIMSRHAEDEIFIMTLDLRDPILFKLTKL